ncbi:hypothetical protein I7I53_08372 [Histoplasma capsulatum var. duboisii H88]|uniref:Uncharacterized protein n=1 Tax=Ajellomyces capsulatus (strain H88) TaxID=544711 RepID=A0A8A1LF35_AJEC8|nr:hypothetical protein I7I53_08372 [Histoplasma capsulatum var. duboisii H88]
MLYSVLSFPLKRCLITPAESRSPSRRWVFTCPLRRAPTARPLLQKFPRHRTRSNRRQRRSNGRTTRRPSRPRPFRPSLKNQIHTGQGIFSMAPAQRATEEVLVVPMSTRHRRPQPRIRASLPESTLMASMTMS